MKKVITFSLWGKMERYTIGAIKNAKLMPILYSDFELYIYLHTPTVPESIVNELKSFPFVTIIPKTTDLTKDKPMMWRFEAIDDPDVEIMMPRDTDTRFLIREQTAVKEWLKSDTLFHIMRDHPKHTGKIFGGMFGTRKLPSIPSWKDEMKKITQKGHRNYDVTFLEKFIYPKILSSYTLHTSFKFFPNEPANPFPTPYSKDLRFIGEYVYEDESRCQKSINILRKNLHKQIKRN